MTATTSCYICCLWLLLFSLLVPNANATYVISKVVNPGPEPKIHPRLRSDLLEGDILVDKQEGKGYRSAVSNKRLKWADNTVPYVIDPRISSTARKAIDAAVEDYKKFTCVRYVPRTTERDYVNFFAGDGCYSIIGRKGGKQPISLGRGCEVKGVAIHEMMHTLGFYHEQSRWDRDSYVTIIWSNIARGLSDQFTKESTDNQKLPYDFSSVMHYEATAFSSNGRDTIIPKVRSVSIGQRRGLSEEDIKKINSLYGCPGGIATTTEAAITEAATTAAPDGESGTEEESSETETASGIESTATETVVEVQITEGSGETEKSSESESGDTTTTTTTITTVAATIKKKRKKITGTGAAETTAVQQKKKRKLVQNNNYRALATATQTGSSKVTKKKKLQLARNPRSIVAANGLAMDAFSPTFGKLLRVRQNVAVAQAKEEKTGAQNEGEAGNLALCEDLWSTCQLNPAVYCLSYAPHCKKTCKKC